MAAGVRVQGARRVRLASAPLLIGIALAAVALVAGLQLFAPDETGVEVLVANRDLPLGSVVQDGDLRVERQALQGGMAELALRAGERDRVVGKALGRPVAAGEILVGPAVSSTSPLRAGEVAAGVPVTPNRTFVPHDLSPGDRVAVYATGGSPGAYQTALLIGSARVLAVVRQETYNVTEDSVGMPGTPAHVILAVQQGEEAQRLAEAVAISAVTLVRLAPEQAAATPTPAGGRTPAATPTPAAPTPGGAR